jgi:hypothetical protein
MSYFNKLLVLTIFGLALTAFCLAANAQVCPILDVPPITAPGLMAPFGNAGNGITDSVSYTTGSGQAAATDAFTSNFLGQNAIQSCGLPLGLGLWSPCCCGCGLGGLGGSNFASFGPFQTGVGNTLGTQSTSASGLSRATSFGLQPNEVAFGIPVVGQNGFTFT